MQEYRFTVYLFTDCEIFTLVSAALFVNSGNLTRSTLLDEQDRDFSAQQDSHTRQYVGIYQFLFLPLPIFSHHIGLSVNNL